MDDHISHLELVFACFLQHWFYLKKFKCIIALQSIEYLGHVVSPQDVGPDLEKNFSNGEMVGASHTETVTRVPSFNGVLHKVCQELQFYCPTIDKIVQKRCISMVSNSPRCFWLVESHNVSNSSIEPSKFWGEFRDWNSCFRGRNGSRPHPKRAPYLLIHELPVNCLAITIPHRELLGNLDTAITIDTTMKELIT